MSGPPSGRSASRCLNKSLTDRTNNQQTYNPADETQEGCHQNRKNTPRISRAFRQAGPHVRRNIKMLCCGICSRLIERAHSCGYHRLCELLFHCKLLILSYHGGERCAASSVLS